MWKERPQNLPQNTNSNWTQKKRKKTETKKRKMFLERATRKYRHNDSVYGISAIWCYGNCSSLNQFHVLSLKEFQRDESKNEQWKIKTARSSADWVRTSEPGGFLILYNSIKCIQYSMSHKLSNSKELLNEYKLFYAVGLLSLNEICEWGIVWERNKNDVYW